MKITLEIFKKDQIIITEDNDTDFGGKTFKKTIEFINGLPNDINIDIFDLTNKSVGDALDLNKLSAITLLEGVQNEREIGIA